MSGRVVIPPTAPDASRPFPGLPGLSPFGRGKEWAHLNPLYFSVSGLAGVASRRAAALRCGALRSFIGGALQEHRRRRDHGRSRPVAILATDGRKSLMAAGTSEQTRHRGLAAVRTRWFGQRASANSSCSGVTLGALRRDAFSPLHGDA